MDIRQANADDVAEIRRVASESLAESYGHAVDEELIDSVVEKWYGSEDLSSDLAADDTYFVVAEEDGRLIGFAQSYLISRREIVGELDWLHVDPESRGKGVGAALRARRRAVGRRRDRRQRDGDGVLRGPRLHLGR